MNRTYQTYVFLALDFCRFCVVIRVFSSPPQRPMTSDFEGFSIPDFIHYIYFPILILEKETVFPFSMFSAKQGNYVVAIFITSLLWRGPWVGIEPGTSRTRWLHSTTRLSRRYIKLIGRRIQPKIQSWIINSWMQAP